MGLAVFPHKKAVSSPVNQPAVQDSGIVLQGRLLSLRIYGGASVEALSSPS